MLALLMFPEDSRWSGRKMLSKNDDRREHRMPRLPGLSPSQSPATSTTPLYGIDSSMGYVSLVIAGGVVVFVFVICLVMTCREHRRDRSERIVLTDSINSGGKRNNVKFITPLCFIAFLLNSICMLLAGFAAFWHNICIYSSQEYLVLKKCGIMAKNEDLCY